MKQIQWIGLTALTLFLLIRGVIPAIGAVGTDFPNYYTSSKLLVTGNDMSKLYDDNWFQAQIYTYGMNQLGKFAPFPPITAFIMTPLVFLSPESALRIWTVINLAVLLLAVFLLSEITKKSWLWSMLLFLLSGHALANNFKFGQFYLILTVLVLAGYRYWIHGEHIKGGVILGIGAAVKYFPVLFFLEFIRRRQWRIVLSGFVTMGILTAISVIVLGPAIHKQFLLHVLGQHIQGNIQNPFSPTFQSWNSLFRRLFVFDSGLNPRPVLNSLVAYLICLSSIYGVVTVLLVSALRKSSLRFGESGHEIQFALLGITGLLLLPASATYHFLLLTLPVALLLNRKVWTIPQRVLAVLYGLIGFIPYHYFDRFETVGVLAVLSYPRLILMSGLFAASIAVAWTGLPDSLRPTLLPKT